jgi:hypothetical protein
MNADGAMYGGVGAGFMFQPIPIPANPPMAPPTRNQIKHSMLVATQFGSLTTNQANILADTADAINVYRMITGESSQHDAGDRGLISREGHRSPKKCCRIGRVVASGHHILHSDKVCGSLAHPLQPNPPESFCHSALLALRILKVSDLVRDYEREFARILLKKVHHILGDCNGVRGYIGISIHGGRADYHQLKLWHRIRYNPALSRIFAKAFDDLIAYFYRALEFIPARLQFRQCLWRLRRNVNTEQKTAHYRDWLHDARNYMPLLNLGQEALLCLET